DHISTHLLKSYGQRRLEAEELFAMDDHFSSCTVCRERFRQLKTSSSALFSLRASLQVADEAAPTHLPYEQLMAYTRGRLEGVDRELAESHLEVCARCTAQGQGLHDRTLQQARPVNNFSTSADGESLPPALWTRLVERLSLSSLQDRFLPPPFTLRTAVAVAVMALAFIAVGLWLRPQNDGREIVSRS